MAINIKRLKKIARRLPDVSTVQAIEFVTMLAAIERATDMTEEDSREIKTALGQAFRNMRNRTQMTQKVFCDKTGISQAQLSILESGKAGINAYAPAFFSLSVFGTEAILEKVKEFETEWSMDLNNEQPQST
jgi:DNA-binding transcriptional regulator YiaG